MFTTLQFTRFAILIAVRLNIFSVRQQKRLKKQLTIVHTRQHRNRWQQCDSKGNLIIDCIVQRKRKQMAALSKMNA